LFVVSKDLITDTYTRRSREQDITTKYLNKFSQMVIASDNDVWNPNPSGLCRAWCEVLECAHNGRN